MTTRPAMTIFERSKSWIKSVHLAIMALIFTVIGVALTSCASIPVGRYQALRVASQDVLAKTSETYSRIERRQHDFVIMTEPNRPLTADSFRPMVQGISYDIAPELRYRESAIRVLVSYTDVLEALASKDFESDVDRSVQDLSSRLRALNNSPGFKEASNGFASVVDVVGRGTTNRMKKKALANTMDRAQPAVDKLCLLVQGSNNKITEFVNMMRDRYVAHANVARPAYGTAARYKSDMEVADIIEESVQITEALKSTSVAIGKLPQAHREIRESLDQKEQPLTALREMLAEAQRLQGFYKNLPNK